MSGNLFISNRSCVVCLIVTIFVVKNEACNFKSSEVELKEIAVTSVTNLYQTVHNTASELENIFLFASNSLQKKSILFERFEDKLGRELGVAIQNASLELFAHSRSISNTFERSSNVSNLVGAIREGFNATMNISQRLSQSLNKAVEQEDYIKTDALSVRVVLADLKRSVGKIQEDFKKDFSRISRKIVEVYEKFQGKIKSGELKMNRMEREGIVEHLKQLSSNLNIGKDFSDGVGADAADKLSGAVRNGRALEKDCQRWSELMRLGLDSYLTNYRIIFEGIACFVLFLGILALLAKKSCSGKRHPGNFLNKNQQTCYRPLDEEIGEIKTGLVK